jgi:hypothetical protein
MKDYVVLADARRLDNRSQRIDNGDGPARHYRPSIPAHVNKSR